MYYVWTNWHDKDRRLRVAGADVYEEACSYAVQYLDEGPVTIRKGSKNLFTFPKIT